MGRALVRKKNVTAAELATYDNIVRKEIWRIGHVPGYDFEDLKQEALVAATRAISRYDPKRGDCRRLVRSTVRNRLINVKRGGLTSGRTPQDHYGRRMHYGVRSLSQPIAIEGDEIGTLLDALPSSVTQSDTIATHRELVRVLESRLSKAEMSLLVEVFVEGARLGRNRVRGAKAQALELVRKQARDVLTRLISHRMLQSSEHRVDHSSEEEQMAKAKKVELPPVDVQEVECHALAPTGPGYDPEDPTCHTQCPDKFSCVQALVDSRTKNTKNITLETDQEVKAVLTSLISLEDAHARMKRRLPILQSGGKIPDELSVTVPIVVAKAAKKVEAEEEEAEAEESDAESEEEAEAEEEASEEEAETEDAEEEEEASEEQEESTEEEASEETAEEEDDEDEEEEETTMATKKSTKKATKATKATAAKATSAKKPATKAKAAKKASGAKRGPRIPKSERTQIYGKDSNRFLPQAREITEDQMALALSRVKLGQPFELGIGMEIVRKKRDGSEVAVKITKNGFVMDGETYSSLSAAGQWASKRAVSGNDFFNVETYSCTEIRGKGVPGGVYSKLGEGQKAVVGAHTEKAAKPAKKKGAAKKAAKAPAKKAGAKKTAPPPKTAAKKAAAKTAKK